MSSMQLSIIARFQDRASRGMRALLRMQKQHERMQKAYGNATAQAARKQAELARAGNRAARAMGNETSAAGRLRAALSRVNAMIRRQVSLRERLRRAGSLAREGAGRIGRAGMLAAGIYGSVQAAAASAASLVVGPAAQMEKFQTVLETTEGSAQKAKASLDWITRFAVITPYELNEVTEAFVQLRAYGLDPTNGLLRTLGDTAAAMNKPIMQAVEAIADAVTGENERLKEFGIKARAAGKYFYYEYTENGVTKVAKALKTNRAQIQEVLTGIFQAKYGGAMEKLSKTWTGMISNMADMWFKFRLMVAQSGVFEFLKSKLQFLLETLNRLEASGKLQKIAQEIGASIIQGLKALWQFGLGVWAVLQKVGVALSWAAEKLGGWNNLAMALMALPLLNVLASFVSGFMLLGQAVMAVAPALALLATPAGLVAGALAAIAAAVAGVIWYFVLWPSITAAVSAAWNGIVSAGEALVAWFSTLPARVQGYWESLKAWLSSPFDPFPNLRQRVQGVITMLAALPQQAMQALAQLRGWLINLDIGQMIRAIDWRTVLLFTLPGAINALLRAFTGIDLMDAGIKALQSFWDGMKLIMKSLAAWAKNKLASIFSLPSWARGWFGGSQQKASEVQKRASGGPYRRGPLLVGERGPELIYPARSGWVAHNDNLKRLASLSRRAAAGIAAAGLATHMVATQPRIVPAGPPSAATSIREQGGGMRMEVHYAPQITVQGNADPAQLRAVLDAHLEDLLERLERRKAENDRLVF